MTITESLSDFLVDLSYTMLPTSVIKAAKVSLLDTLGCILAGAQEEKMSSIIKAFCGGKNPGTTSVIGHGLKTDLISAVMLNGTMGHAVELDDVHKRAKAHAGTVIIPVVLGVGENMGGNGLDAILAIVAGYEVMIRIGTGINAAAHRLQGWHATGTCGTFGSAAAVGKLWEFTPEQLTSALGLAGTQSSGLWAFTADGADCKMFHAGKAAAGGVLACMLAEAGMKGPSQIIEAEDGGLFRASSRDWNTDIITEGLGERFEITEVVRKPFACCRSMHPAIEAALKLRKNTGIKPNQIKRVIVRTYEVAKVQCGFTNRPKNVMDARFSLPYGVAVVFVDGNALLDQFTEKRIRDREVLNLAEKVMIEVDPEFTAAYPRKWGCKLEVELHNGEKVTEIVPDAKGDVSNPLSLGELKEKFIYLAEARVGKQKCAEIIAMLEHLEEVEDIGALVRLCNP